MRIRARFSKTEKAIYISHLNLIRIFERSARRADLPLDYSKGFNPRPKISFASALPLGVSSEDEYVDFDLKKPVMPEEFECRFNCAVPDGLKLETTWSISDSQPALMAEVGWAVYQVRTHLTGGQTPDERNLCAGIIRGFLSQSSIALTKRTKSQSIEIDARPLIKDIGVEKINGGLVLLSMMVAHGNRGTIKPVEVIEAINRYAKELGSDIALDMEDMRVHRSRLLKHDGGNFRHSVA